MRFQMEFYGIEMIVINSTHTQYHWCDLKDLKVYNSLYFKNEESDSSIF